MAAGPRVGTLYAAGLLLIAGTAGAASLAAGPAAGQGIRRALAAVLLVQGPLGWWLVRSLGTDRLLAVWALGILTRFVLVGLAAFVAVPLLGWAPEPLLVSLVVLLVACLGLEGLMLARGQSQTDHANSDRER